MADHHVRGVRALLPLCALLLLASRVGRTAASLPAASEDYFHDMDGGGSLTREEIQGRRAGPGGVEFHGTWGFGDAATGGGVWTGARVGR
jgi:hypothetical protein